MLVAEAVADIAEEVAAFGFGAQEMLVIIVGKLEVSIDVAALKPQVQHALSRVVGDRDEHF